MASDKKPRQWLEHELLPGYMISRSTVVRTEWGAKNGCPDPALGRNERGELALWVKPIGHTAAMRLRIEGLKNFFHDEKTDDR